METLTTYHKRSRIQYLAKLIHDGEAEPGTSVTLSPHTLEEVEHGKKRVGRPRLNWYQVTLQGLWKEVIKDHPTPAIRFAAHLDIKKPPHVQAVKDFARTLTERLKKK